MPVISDSCVQLIWPKLALSDGSYLEFLITRDDGGNYGGASNKLSFLYNPTSVIRFDSPIKCPFITNQWELSQKFTNTRGVSAVDSFYITFHDQLSYTSSTGGTENFEASGSTVLQEFYRNNQQSDKPYWIWVKHWINGSLAEIPFVGIIRGWYRPTKNVRLRDPQSGSEQNLNQLRTVQCVSALSLLKEKKWSEVVANTWSSDTQQGRFFSGIAQYNVNIFDGQSFAQNTNQGWSIWGLTDYAYMPAEPFIAVRADTTDGPMGDLFPNTGYDADAFFSAADGPQAAAAWYGSLPSGNIPQNFPQGTYGITIDTIVSKIAASNYFTYTANDFSISPQIFRQLANNTTHVWDIDTTLGNVATASNLWVNFNVYFGYHPFDGMNGGLIVPNGQSGVGCSSLPIEPCRAASTTNLSASYSAGTGSFHGVGATLTNTGTLAQLQIDGVLLVNGDRVLIAGQTTQNENGIYTVTTQGNGSTAWVLTRTSDWDGSLSYEFFGGGGLFFNAYFVLIAQGNSYAGYGFSCDLSNVTGFDFSSTNIVWQINNGSAFRWNTPVTFGLNGTQASVLSLLCNFAVNRAYLVADTTTGIPALKFRSQRDPVGTVPSKWVLSSTENVPPSQFITNVDVANTGDDLHYVCPISNQASPKNFLVPFRLRRIGTPTFNSGGYPVDDFGTTPNMMDFDENLDIESQVGDCLRIADWVQGVWTGTTPNTPYDVRVNPDCWKGMCFIYLFTSTDPSPNPMYPNKGDANGDSSNPWRGLLRWDGAGHTKPHTFENSFFALGAQYGPGVTPTNPETNYDRFNTLLYPATELASFTIGTGIEVERRYIGYADNSGMISTLDVGMQGTWQFEGASTTFVATQLTRQPRSKRSIVRFAILPPSADAGSIQYGWYNGSGAGGGGTSTSGAGGSGNGQNGSGSGSGQSWHPVRTVKLTGTGVVTIPNTDSAILVTSNTVTGVTAPTLVTAPQTLVITNKTGKDWTAGDFFIANNDTWLLYYDGTATKSDPTLPQGWNIMGRSS